MSDIRRLVVDKQEKVFMKLQELNIPYEVIHHPAVYTMEEIDEIGLNEEGDIVKNLFLRDDKGRNHYLVTLDKDKKADLVKLREQLGSTKLGFASAERLEKYLDLSKGAVSPLGIINDATRTVNMVFDKDLVGRERIGVHPNDNTATVYLSFDNLKKIIEKNGNRIIYVNI
jgi:Uncharacterized conserved protein